MKKECNTRLKDMDIVWRNEVSYLEVNMETKLTRKNNIEYARSTRAKLYPMTKKKSKLALWR